MTRTLGSGPRRSPLRRYQETVVGRRGLTSLLKYEILTGCIAPLPGAAGLLLRSLLYRALLGTAGRGVTIGRYVSLRCPGRIHLERGVMIDDLVELSARGEHASIRIGEGTLISRGTILHARDGSIEIGPNGSIGTQCRIGTAGTMKIGRDALIAAGCMIGGGNHPMEVTDAPIASRPAESLGVTIGDDVWLGVGATVLDGVTIGRGAVVGARALVIKDVPEMAVVVGVPARILRFRDGRPAPAPTP